MIGSELAERIAVSQRKANLKSLAERAALQTEDAFAEMKSAKSRLEFEIADMRRNPTSVNRDDVVNMATIYRKAAAGYLAALFAQKFTDKMADGFGIAAASKYASEVISPNFEQVRAQVAIAEKQCQAANAANVNKIENSFAPGQLVREFDASASMARAVSLYDIVKMPGATAADGDNLLTALDAAKIERKQARVEWRDAKVAEFIASGDSEKTARAKVAALLRQERKETERTGERAEYFAQRRDMRVAACELCITGALHDHSQAKNRRIAASVERDVARNAGDMESLRQSMQETYGAAAKMALAIVRELTYENIKKFPMDKKQARQMALEQFRAEHEKRLGMSVEEKKQLRREGKLDTLPITPDMSIDTVKHRIRWNKQRHDSKLLQQHRDEHTPHNKSGTIGQTLRVISHGAQNRDSTDGAHAHSAHMHRRRVVLPQGAAEFMGMKMIVRGER